MIHRTYEQVTCNHKKRLKKRLEKIQLKEDLFSSVNIKLDCKTETLHKKGIFHNKLSSTKDMTIHNIHISEKIYKKK